MRVTLADLASQYRSIKAEIDAAVTEVLESGHLVLGPFVERLEAEIAAYCGAAHAVAVNSGTDALLLALRAQGIGPGDEVITTPFTFVATVEAIVHAGATPVFADIDPATFNLSPAAAAERITSRTRAIMPVDLFGQMADREAFSALRERHGLAIIWDSAQAIGAEFGGKPIGAFADAATLSFFPTKNLGAYGDGGMVLTNDAAVAERVRRYRFHGSGGGYLYSEVGYCSRLDAMQAAILHVKLGRLNEWNEARRSHAAAYRALLADAAVVLPPVDPRAKHTYHQFTLRSQQRDALKKRLAAAGVDCGIYYPLALHLQEAYARWGHGEGDYPEAERACREVLSIPVHPGLTEEQLGYVADAIRAFARSESLATSRT